MNKRLLTLAFIAIFGLSSARSDADRALAATSAELKLIFTSNRQGEIEPCGCQAGQIGGLDRFWSYVNQERPLGTSALFVDAGDTFFSSPKLNAFHITQEKLRAELIAKSYRQMRLDFFSPGPNDLAQGWAFLKELENLSGATFISTNVAPKKGKAPFKRSAVLRLGGYRVGVLSAANKEDFQSLDARVLPWRKEIEREISKLKKQVDVIVVLSHLGLTSDKVLATVPGVDLIVGSRSIDVLDKPVQVGKALIVQPNIEGQQGGVLSFRKGFPEQAKHQLTNLDSKFDGENPVTKLVEEYRAKVRELAMLAGAEPAPKSEKETFVAKPHFCKNCHGVQHEFWERTKHASAYLVLYAKNQHFDPECISCHTLGYRMDGGFSKIAHPYELADPKKSKEPFIEVIMKDTFKNDPGKGALDSRVDPKRYEALKKEYHKQLDSHLENGEILKDFVGVQCEHCHGSRVGHPDPKVVTQKKVVAESCLKCHMPPNDTDFDFAKQVKSVACPPLTKR